MGVRVHTLAKELEMQSKELIGFLRTQGLPVKSHMSTIDDHVATIVRERIRRQRPPKPPAARATTPDAKKAGQSSSTAASTAAGTPKPGAGTDSKPSGGSGWNRPAAAAGTERRGGKPTPADEQKQKEGTRRKRYFPTQDDLLDSGPRFVGTRRKFVGRGRGRKGRDGGVAVTERPSKVEVGLPVTLKELSAALALKANLLIRTLMQQGQVVTINQFLDEDQVTLIGLEYEVEITFKKKEADAEARVLELEEYESEADHLLPRAPVVTFLGHVDHGKTSILDWIRKSKVTAGEAGGITQHLGAYRVDAGDIQVVFIDTPGHKAFTEMRARGANVTDVAVLVVAADDGVMPQTEEAINHARAAKVPIVVALNKIDKPDANPARAKQQLAELDLLPVEWNGDTEFVEISAIDGQGMDTLLETLSLTSEILELKGDPKRQAIGTVLEAENTQGQGVVAMVLVQDGTLRQGDHILAGSAHGRVRNLLLNGITPVKEAGPSMPVKITGLSEVPEAGDRLYGVKDPQEARAIAEERAGVQRQAERAARQQITLENLFSQLEQGELQELRVILKADTKGSLVALSQSLESLSTEEVGVKILHTGVGAVSQDDIGLADASQAIVIGFHVTSDERARALAEERSVEVRVYDVIYKAIDDVRDAMASRLTPDREEQIRSHSEIRQVYRASKIGTIAGCFVTDGTVSRSDQIRLLRDGRIVHTGTLGSLKRFKDDVKEVKGGFECGIKVAGYDDIKEGDVIESFVVVEKPRTL